ncbi:MAG TPA: M81 family peptidase, partial [Spirochaetes bacterium]|nr:M81 family peptidase [Spirochaetota bacterium]
MEDNVMKRLFILAAIVVAVSMTLGCGKKQQTAPGEKKTILFAELLQETNSFSPVLTTERDFKAESLLFGEEIIPYSLKEKRELAGFLKAVHSLGNGRIELVPLVKARSMSGGPVERALYERIKKTIVDGVRKQKKVDGIYLSMHGAMGVQGIRDPEGDLLEAVRAAVGKDVPIGVSFDLHANNTAKRAKNADFIVGYKTNPHRDHFDTGYRCGSILIKAALGEVKPVMTVTKMRLLKGGGMNIDFISPFRKIFKRMKAMEKDPAVLDMSFFPVHIWLDDPELGYSTVAVTDGDKTLAKKLAEEIADMAWAVREVPHPKGSTPEEGIEIARK